MYPAGEEVVLAPPVGFESAERTNEQTNTTGAAAPLRYILPFFYAAGAKISVNVAGKCGCISDFQAVPLALALDTIIGEIWSPANRIAWRDSINPGAK